ncbi:MAG: ComF family protein [Bilifractor sp.]
MAGITKDYAAGLLEIIYPRHCPFCDRLLSGKEPYLCRSCAGKLKFISGPVCLKCGRPLERDTLEYCDNCRRKEHRFIRGFAPFTYRGSVQDSITRFKYGRRAEYAAFYAAAIRRSGEEMLSVWKPELIIPVPIHPERYRKRGYNQAEEVGRALAKALEIPCARNGIYRRKNTKPQKGLTPSMRRSNLQNAFTVDKGVRLPERVLLVDDIYTTGTTLDALTEAVMDAGARRVWFACISIAPGRGN